MDTILDRNPVHFDVAHGTLEEYGPLEAQGPGLLTHPLATAILGGQKYYVSP